jgi:hypothetical protein
MKTHLILFALIAAMVADVPLEAASRKGGGALVPTHNTIKRGSYTIETTGDTLHQAKPENTRMIIRISGPDKKLIKPASIVLIGKNGAAIKPVFREDRKVGHEENTGLPLSVGGYGDGSGVHSTGVGINLNKVFGPHGSYAYTKVDWPKQVFTADKKLQIVLPGGQAIVLPLTSIAQ